MSYEEFAAKYSEDIANLADPRWDLHSGAGPMPGRRTAFSDLPATTGHEPHHYLRNWLMTPRERYENPNAYYCAVTLYHPTGSRYPAPLTVAQLNGEHKQYRCLARFCKASEVLLYFDKSGTIRAAVCRGWMHIEMAIGPRPYWRCDLDGNLCRTDHGSRRRWGDPDLPEPTNGIYCCPPGIKTYLDPESPEGRAELAIHALMDRRPPAQ